MQAVNRRNWIKQSSLAALGLGISLRSIAGEDYLPRNFGAESGLINLGANENPYGISPKAKEAIMQMIGEANRYQFNVNSLKTFTKQLAEYYGVTESHVLVTAGSGEGLALLARHFNKGNIVTADPTFGILPSTAKKTGTKVIEVPLTPSKVHDLEAMLKAINKETNLVYICNPANPTSTMVKPAAMKNFCIEATRKTVVLIDEAYIDFLDAPDNESMISLIEKNPNILVIRTFSKIHAMAGLRVGFIIGNPSLIEQIESNYFYSSRMCVSNLSMVAALASLEDEEHRKQCKQKIGAARQYTFDELVNLRYNVIPSYTNFIFFELKNYSGNFSKDMLRKNIILRSMEDGKWARVSIGTQEEMKIFISTMKAMQTGS